MAIHVHGYIEKDYDGVCFKGRYDSIADQIAGLIKQDCSLSKHQPEDDYRTTISLNLPKVYFRIYLSDNEISLEEAVDKQILMEIGELDIYSEWYGYSEYTIEGYSIENFTIGNHDIESILESNVGKYAHIVMEILE